ncbi:MAG: hypothetical protein IPL47_14930 [Phyllobacteriaceae bacterium]|nr:hypothetical protein [Phyllobacteriaceae bacterium]
MLAEDPTIRRYWATALEAFGSAYDAWDVYSTFTDPQATTQDKTISVVGSAAGSFLPGAGFSVLGKQIAKRSDEAAQAAKLSPAEKGKIVGTPQRTSREAVSAKPLDAHQIGSLRAAITHAKNPEVGKVFLNKSVNTVLGTKGVSSKRPDVAATSWDRKKVWMDEVPSGRQTSRNQRGKMDAIRDRPGFPDKDKTRNSIAGRKSRGE